MNTTKTRPSKSFALPARIRQRLVINLLAMLFVVTVALACKMGWLL